MEAKLEIQEKAPEVFTAVAKSGLVNWEHVREDMQSLGWMEDVTESQTIQGTWEIVDKAALAALQGSEREKTLKVSCVRSFITRQAQSLQTQQEKARAVSEECRSAIQGLRFLKQAAEAAQVVQELPEFSEVVANIEGAFTSLKKTVTNLFMHLDKYFARELNQNLTDLLDFAFNQAFVLPLRDRLVADPRTRGLVTRFDRTYAPVYTSFNYSKPKNNLYCGQVDEENRRCGYGKMTHANEDVYEGNWLNNQPHGQGVYTWKDHGTYQGEFCEGKLAGFGRRVYVSGNVYEGGFKDNRKHGEGTMTFKVGDKYEGHWENDQMHGLGKYTWRTGDYYEGHFVNDKRTGAGTLTLTTGEVYEGEWKDNVMLTEQDST